MSKTFERIVAQIDSRNNGTVPEKLVRVQISSYDDQLNLVGTEDFTEWRPVETVAGDQIAASAVARAVLDDQLGSKLAQIAVTDIAPLRQ